MVLGNYCFTRKKFTIGCFDFFKSTAEIKMIFHKARLQLNIRNIFSQYKTVLPFFFTYILECLACFYILSYTVPSMELISFVIVEQQLTKKWRGKRKGGKEKGKQKILQLKVAVLLVNFFSLSLWNYISIVKFRIGTMHS